MSRKFHIAMCPWFAMGHLIPFLRLSNKLASLGHKISFFTPSKTQLKLNPFNLHPHHITFIPITVPHVDGLPPGAEITHDVPHSLGPLIMAAMELTKSHVEKCLGKLKPDFVFFDTAHWIPSIAGSLGIKSVLYSTVSAAFAGYTYVPGNADADFSQPPSGFPDSTIKLSSFEAYMFKFFKPLIDQMIEGLQKCDAIAFKTCREIEGSFCDFLERQFEKPVLLTSPLLPDQPNSTLDSCWGEFLENFKPGSVVYCSFGSEVTLNKDQMQELLLGFELSGLPFLLALKPPEGMERIEDAFPYGFEERVRGRGVVYGGWVQQQLILQHPSVGCFVTHCGWGSLFEGLVNDCQIVLLPYGFDQFVNARFFSGDLKVGVAVEKRDEDGWFTKESVCKAVLSAMDEESEIGREANMNHAKLKKLLTADGFEASYIQSFANKLEGLLA